MTAWRLMELGELVKSSEASLQTGPFGTQLHASDYVDSGIPVINVRNIGFGTLRAEKLEFIAPSTRDRLSAHVLREGDIVFGRKGAVERHVHIRAQQEGWFQGSDCIRLRLASPRLLSSYASYCFLTPQHQQWMARQCSHGATMASLNQGVLERISLSLPPVPIQRQVVGILSAYDGLIENCERRIKVLDELARSLYREWFVAFRWPRSLRVQAPANWALRPIGELVETLGGGTPSRKEAAYWDDGKIPWYAPSDLTRAGSHFMERPGEFISNLGLSKSSAKVFRARSVMMTSRATIGAIAINVSEACTNQGFITCVPSHTMPLFTLYHWLRESVPLFERLATGATFKEISRGVFRAVELAVPPANLTAEFEARCSPIYELVLNLQRQSSSLRAARDLVLPPLLDGRTSIAEAA